MSFRCNKSLNVFKKFEYNRCFAEACHKESRIKNKSEKYWKRAVNVKE